MPSHFRSDGRWLTRIHRIPKKEHKNRNKISKRKRNVENVNASSPVCTFSKFSGLRFKRPRVQGEESSGRLWAGHSGSMWVLGTGPSAGEAGHLLPRRRPPTPEFSDSRSNLTWKGGEQQGSNFIKLGVFQSPHAQEKTWAGEHLDFKELASKVEITIRSYYCFSYPERCPIWGIWNSAFYIQIRLD